MSNINTDNTFNSDLSQPQRGTKRQKQSNWRHQDTRRSQRPRLNISAQYNSTRQQTDTKTIVIIITQLQQHELHQQQERLQPMSSKYLTPHPSKIPNQIHATTYQQTLIIPTLYSWFLLNTQVKPKYLSCCNPVEACKLVA